MENVVCQFWSNSFKNPCDKYLKGGYCTLPFQFRCIEYIRKNEVKMSYSSMLDASACKRKYYYSAILGIELVKPPIRMQMGRIASDLLDVIHNQGSSYVQIDRYFDQFAIGDDELNNELAAARGLFKAYIKLPASEMRGKTQCHWEWSEDGYPKLHGYLDVLEIETIGWEFKYTARPINFTKFTISDQLSTYFLGNPELQRMTLRTIQVPMLRRSKEEDIEDFAERITKDVLSRPRHYVNDSNYWRNEFNLDEVKDKSKWLVAEIKEYADHGIYRFYQNRQACFFPSQCQFYQICDSGVISEQLYRKRENRKNEKLELENDA